MDTPKKPPRPVPKPSSYTKPFWEGARDKKLMLQYDPDSKTFQFWPRPTSVKTGKTNLEWRQSSGKGTLYSYTVVHVPAPGFEDRVPYIVGLIELQEGVRIISNLVGVDAQGIKIGMPMRVTWEPLGDSNYYAFEPDK